MTAAPRRLVVTVCPREPGAVVLAVERGESAVRLDARAVLDRLRALVAARGLEDDVRLREGCAGGCAREGPNVGVEILSPRWPGEREDHVAIGWRTYVYSLATLPCLAAVVDDNLGGVAPRRRRAARAGVSAGGAAAGDAPPLRGAAARAGSRRAGPSARR